jgi:hypothetical protein
MDIYDDNTQQLLFNISYHCPEALSTYLHIFNRSNSHGTVYFTREKVEEDLSESWCRFKNNIKKLAREGILEWHPMKRGISITLADLETYE